MKRTPHILALAAAAALVWTGCDKPKGSPSNPKPEAKLSPSPSVNTNAMSGLTSGALAPPAISQPLFETNIFMSTQSLPALKRTEPTLRTFPGPGVYETVPYSMLVIVPEPCDEHFVVKVDDPGSRMPIIKPNLEFIPRGRANK